MTEIAIQQDNDAVIPDRAVPGTDLVQWMRQAEAAAVYAERVCSTAMVPAAYKNKPAEAAAAILAGAELGFSPMAALRAFDNIQGVPAPKAITLRAVVTGAGHEIVTVHQSPQRAEVKGRRKGSEEWQTSVWTIERAIAAGYVKKNPNYQSKPADMLVARATAEVCRWVGSDAIMGMPYAAEEISDEPAPTNAPPVRRITIGELAQTPEEVAEDGEVVEESISREQQKRMFTLWDQLGYGGDENREQRLAITAKILKLPELASSNDLTAEQADRVIAALTDKIQQSAANETETEAPA